MNTVPVLFQIKEFIPETQANKLYVTVTAKKQKPKVTTQAFQEKIPRNFERYFNFCYFYYSRKDQVGQGKTGILYSGGIGTKLECRGRLDAECFPDSWLSEAQKQGKQAVISTVKV